MKKTSIFFTLLFFVLAFPVAAKGDRGGDLEKRNQAAIESMSVVATRVQELLEVETDGIGEQVSEIAKEQNQAQGQVQEQLRRLNSS